MNREQRQRYLERYKELKEKGVPFFPDVLLKDAVLSLLVLLILIGLSYFFGAPLEERADPADTTYTPRPEWYFLFLFQLLKFFPGNLEVIGVFVLPTLVILALFALPFLDSSADRHPLDRPWVTGITTIGMLAIGFLTVQAFLEAPPPGDEPGGDPVAILYSENCAGCHGSRIDVPTGTNLHEVIAEGRHGTGMPAWSADLTTDEIDALAGFILSPSGSALFNQNCAECHAPEDLVASDPIRLKQSLELGSEFQPHLDVGVPNWQESLNQQERTALLNFLVAPDGQRLFATNCSSCHGQSVAFSGDREDLREVILEGGQHLEMPPWRGRLSEEQVGQLSSYVVAPLENPQVEALFRQNCSSCHGGRIPRAASEAEARQIILEGGAHETMPVWGDFLTDEQTDALVSFTLQAARGTSVEIGRQLFTQHCSACHGDFGEGGPNPSRQDDVIAPISSAEYLQTRDDITLLSIISRGQPNFGMSPFSTAFGGPLDSDQIDAIVAYMRSWEENPPVELPPEVRASRLNLTGGEIFADLCAQCHGDQGQGLIGPSLRASEFQTGNTDDDIFRTINLGHEATAMIGWGEVLTADQIQQLVDFIRELPEDQVGGPPSFSRDVAPIFDRACASCHGELGGWDASTYQLVIESGDHAPVIIPGDPENSLLVQKMKGTQSIGGIMPPGGLLSDREIELVEEWVRAGAPDN